MAYLKPQSPLQHKDGDYFYPLTTVDQVIMEDGSRLNTKLDNLNGGGAIDIEGVVYAGDESVDSVTAPIDADTLGGKPESELSVAKAVDSDTLGGQLPSYYARATQVTPRNLLDNSDFTNPVNQRGKTSTISDWTYWLDRWMTNASNNGLTLTSEGIEFKSTTSKNDRVVQVVPSEIIKIGKTYTLAICSKEYGVKCHSGIYDGENVLLGIFSGIYIRLEPRSTSDHYFIIDIYTNLTLEWAALYEGEYTAETLPEYQPKGYGVELAECKRYYRQIVSVADVSANTILNGYISSDAKRLYVAVPFADGMRATPNVTFTGSITVRGVTGYLTEASYSAPYANPIVASIKSDNGNSVGIEFTKTDGTAWAGATNNTPISIVFYGTNSKMTVSADI